MKKIWLILLIALLLPAMALGDTTVTMTFLGDCTLGSEENLANKAKSLHGFVKEKGYDYFFENVQDVIGHDDVTIANLENVFSDSKRGEANKTYAFRGLMDFATILPLSSIDAVNLSNNHTMDYGKRGFEDTIKALDAVDVGYFNHENVYVFEKNGISIAFVSLTRAHYGSKGKAFYALIKKLKEDGADAVVVSYHYGQEYSKKHNKGQAEMAYRAIDAGADLVVGHHPHVIQGLEVYKNKYIVYSLGNFVFGGNTKVRAMESIMAQVTMDFSDSGELKGQQLRIYPVFISDDEKKNTFHPHLVTGANAKRVYDILRLDAKGMVPENYQEPFLDLPRLAYSQE